MAKIAIFHNSPVFFDNEWQTFSYYEGLIKAFIDNGNYVMQFVTNDFLVKPWDGDNQAANINYQEQVLSAVKDFNPDIVISFNNSNIKGLENIISCPIILWEADAPIYFSNRESIKKNIDRYHFFAFSEFVEKDFQSRFGAKPSQIFRIKNATAIKNIPLNKTQNISFIGTRFLLPLSLKNIIQKNHKAAFDLIKSSKGLNEDKIIDLINSSIFKNADLKISDLLYYNNHQNRLTTLSSIAPLGLKLFGDSSWKSTFDFSIDLAMSYDDRLVFSLAHNQDIYNRSKISFNTSHTQAITGYPWRILDILASNSVLVTDPKKDLINDVSLGSKLQTYHSPYEAYELCRKLLENDAMREDIIAASNEVIDKNFRWHHRFAEMEQILGLKLLSLPNKGTYTKFRLSDDKLISFAYTTLIMTARTIKHTKKIFSVKKSKAGVSKSLVKKIYDMTPSILKFIISQSLSHYKSINKKNYDINK